jgi:hypothetical protein
VRPLAEQVHWMFASGFLILALCLFAEGIVGTEVWRRRRWRAYLWPGALFLMGICMWPVMILFTNSTLHMLAHALWAEVLILAGGVELALVAGRLRSRYWHFCLGFALLVSGAASLVHEQNSWLFSRSAFLHHAMGWLLIGAAILPVLRTFKPRSVALATGFAAAFLVLSVCLYADRDVADIFGHLSPVAGAPHR